MSRGRKFLGWFSLTAAACCALGCEAPPSETLVPDRGASLRGPVSPPPLHDLVTRHREALGLSESEEHAIQQLADDARTQLDELHTQIEVRRRALSALLTQEEPDRNAVNVAIVALGAAETELRQGEIGVLLAIRSRLSPEQRAALVTLAADAPRVPPRRDEPPLAAPPRPHHTPPPR